MSDTGISKFDKIQPPRASFTPQARKLSESEISLTESLQPFFTVTPASGTDPEELMKPVYWSHVARRIRPMSFIFAVPRDGLWFAWYLVLYADDHQVKLKKLMFEPLESLKESDIDSDPYQVAWISPPVKWGIRRKLDKEVVKDGFQTKDQAVAWKNQNLSSLGNPNKAA